jgi:hypothetical protein
MLSGCIKYKYIVTGDKINLNTKKVTANNIFIHCLRSGLKFKNIEDVSVIIIMCNAPNTFLLYE